MNRSTPILTILPLLFLLQFSTFATTIRVPADSTTIQSAIVGAVDGDTVLVAPGTYTGPGNKNIELLGKAIVLRSESGPENTIIDCEGSGNGFYIHQSEERSTVISGFPGRGNIDQAPVFVNAGGEDFHLQAGSPGIDQGDPADSFDQEPQPNGHRINLGYYGNTNGAATGDNQKPIIRQIEPAVAWPEGGTVIKISGQNFGNVPGSLTIGGNPLNVQSWTDEEITGTVAPHAPGKVLVEVTNEAGKSDNLAEGFTYRGIPTLRVPSEYPTIQLAVDFANDGDTVLVAPGTYTGPGNRDIDLLGKAIVLRSESGPENTIIDCEGTGRGFYIHQSEERSTVISGFTVRNSGSYGFDIDSFDSPTIQNCIVENAGSYGAYISTSSSALIQQCIFQNGRSYGLYTSSSPNAVIQNCLIYGNQRSGIYSSGNSPLILNCTIYGNRHSTGAGVYCGGQLTMRNSIIWGNSTGTEPSAIYAQSSTVSYSNVEGGFPGLGNIDQSPVFADPSDGDFHLQAGSAGIDQGDPADDFSREPFPNGHRINLGYYGNTSEATAGDDQKPIIGLIEPAESDPTGGTIINVTGQNFSDAPGSLLVGENPLYVILWTNEQIIGTVPPHAPGKVLVEVTNSIGKKDQLAEGFTYMGSPILRVPANFPTIQQAINFANDGDTVLVAPGTYTGVGNKDIDLLGKAIVLRSESGPENTIIDCENSGRGFYIHQNEERSTIISGFTVRNSSSYGFYVDSYESPTIQNCIVENAGNYGVYLSTRSDALVEHCIIRNGSSYGLYASYALGALIRNCLIYGNARRGIEIFNDSPWIINCTIFGNEGSINCSGELRLHNTIVWGNAVDGSDGSITTQSANIRFSDIDENWDGDGNINANPEFINPSAGDFHLANNSPGIDAGDPADDFLLEPIPNGGRVNLGFYGNTVEATVGSADVPEISYISPVAGTSSGGVRDTIWGINFGMDNGSVLYGDSLATIVEWNNDRIICLTPPHPQGIIAVQVRTNEPKTARKIEAFTFTNPIPLRVPQDYATIQAAIDAATDGDLVLVASGIYTGEGNKDLDLRNKAIQLRSEEGPEVTIIDCEKDGRGFYIDEDEGLQTVISGFTIRNSDFVGIYLATSVSPTIENCVLEDNESYGMYWNGNNSPVVQNCVFRRNGRGIYTGSSTEDGLIRNCLIVNNQNQNSFISGAGIYCNYESPLILNCTIVDNHSGAPGGGVYSSEFLRMRNCIVWNNTAPAYPGIFATQNDISFSNIQGGWPGRGNLNLDPQFADPAAGDYHLQAGSPGIDAGALSDGFENEPAPNGERINMGAYGNTSEAASSEPGRMQLLTITPAAGPPDGGGYAFIKGHNLGTESGTVRFGTNASNVEFWSDTLIITGVPPDVPGKVDVMVSDGSGTTEIMASAYTYLGAVTLHVPSEYPTIQRAIDAAADGDTVLIAPGIYTGAGNKELDFLSKAIVLISESGPEVTVIDCEQEGRGFYLHRSERENSVIKGLTIRNSNSTGIYFDNGVSARVENCILEYNELQGMYWSSNNRAVVRNCVFQYNGRGIYTRYNAENGLIQNCLFANNQITQLNGNGAGINCDDDSPWIINCTIVKNRAQGEGGGVYGTQQIKMKNCILWDNKAGVDATANIGAAESDITYSCIQNAWPGKGNIADHPIFLDYYARDFYLHPSSPCIDAGDPDDDYSHEPAPNGRRINMGVYGNTTEAASFSAQTVIIDRYITPGCEPESTVSLYGLNFGDGGILNLGGIAVLDSDISLWTDTLIQFSATAEAIDGAAVEVIANQGTAKLDGSYMFTPKVEYVSGEVSGVWTKDCPGIYILNGDVVVPEGQTLTIEPGVQVLANTDSGLVRLTVYGTLEAIGTETDSIRFSVLPYQIRPGAWSGIELNLTNNSASAQLEYCIVENAQTGITAYHDNIVIGNSTLQNNLKEGLKWDADEKSASGTVQNCTIRNNGGWGIFCGAYTDGRFGQASPMITQNHISSNGLGGIYVEAIAFGASTGDPTSASSSASPNIVKNTIAENQGYAVECYARGRWSDGLTFDAFYRGRAFPRLENNLVRHNGGGIKAETAGTGNNNWLGFAEPEVVNCTFWNNGPTVIFAGDSSKIHITNAIFWNDQVPSITYGENGSTLIAYSNFNELQPGEGNLSAQPQFFDPDNGDFRLLASSPGIDAGSNAAVNENTDFAGNQRISIGSDIDPPIVDMGAFEYRLPQITAQPPSQIQNCEGTLITLTVTTEGDQLNYQWQKDGMAVPGATAAALILADPKVEDSGKYVCMITDELGGMVFSLPTELTIQAGLQPTVQITASEAAICNGEEVTFTAVAEEVGDQPAYEWRLNGISTGVNQPSFNSSNLQQGDQVICLVTTEALCAATNSATSNPIEMTVHAIPEVNFVGTIDPLCENEEPLVLDIGVPAGGAYHGPGVSEGRLDPAVAEVGAHKIYYTYTDMTTTCSNLDSMAFQVLPKVEAQVSIAASDTTLCRGDITVITAQVMNGGEAPAYQWLVNGLEAGTGSPDLQLDQVIDGDEVSCKLTSSETCVLINPVSSPSIIFEVNDPPEVRMDTLPLTDLTSPPFALAVGMPEGGTYSGPGVTENGFFDPMQAGTGIHEIAYTYTDSNGCTAAAATTIEVESVNAVTERYRLDQLKVFPNPSNGRFKVILLENQSTVKPWQLSVYNWQGQKLEDRAWNNWSGEPKSLDLQHLPKGMYLVRISDGTTAFMAHIILQ